MIPDPRINQFVTRHELGTSRRTKPHLTESIVADDAITRCGLRLRDGEGVKLEYEFAPHLPPCRRCVR